MIHSTGGNSNSARKIKKPSNPMQQLHIPIGSPISDNQNKKTVNLKVGHSGIKRKTAPKKSILKTPSRNLASTKKSTPY